MIKNKTTLQPYIQSLLNPFDNSIPQPKILDGKVSRSSGVRLRSTGEISCNTQTTYVALIPGKSNAICWRNIDNQSIPETTPSPFQGHLNYETDRSKISKTRIVGTALRLTLVQGTDRNEGYWEAARITTSALEFYFGGEITAEYNEAVARRQALIDEHDALITAAVSSYNIELNLRQAQIITDTALRQSLIDARDSQIQQLVNQYNIDAVTPKSNDSVFRCKYTPDPHFKPELPQHLANYLVAPMYNQAQSHCIRNYAIQMQEFGFFDGVDMTTIDTNVTLGNFNVASLWGEAMNFCYKDVPNRNFHDAFILANIPDTVFMKDTWRDTDLPGIISTNAHYSTFNDPKSNAPFIRWEYYSFINWRWLIAKGYCPPDTQYDGYNLILPVIASSRHVTPMPFNDREIGSNQIYTKWFEYLEGRFKPTSEVKALNFFWYRKDLEIIPVYTQNSTIQDVLGPVTAIGATEASRQAMVDLVIPLAGVLNPYYLGKLACTPLEPYPYPDTTPLNPPPVDMSLPTPPDTTPLNPPLVTQPSNTTVHLKLNHDLSNHQTYMTGKLRDLHKYQFKLNAVNNVKFTTTPEPPSVNKFVSEDWDSIVIKIHGGTTPATKSVLMYDCISCQEVIYEENTALARLMTPSPYVPETKNLLTRTKVDSPGLLTS